MFRPVRMSDEELKGGLENTSTDIHTTKEEWHEPARAFPLYSPVEPPRNMSKAIIGKNSASPLIVYTLTITQTTECVMSSRSRS